MTLAPFHPRDQPLQIENTNFDYQKELFEQLDGNNPSYEKSVALMKQIKEKAAAAAKQQEERAAALAMMSTQVDGTEVEETEVPSQGQLFAETQVETQTETQVETQMEGLKEFFTSPPSIQKTVVPAVASPNVDRLVTETTAGHPANTRKTVAQISSPSLALPVTQAAVLNFFDGGEEAFRAVGGSSMMIIDGTMVDSDEDEEEEPKSSAESLMELPVEIPVPPVVVPSKPPSAQSTPQQGRGKRMDSEPQSQSKGE